MMEKVDFRPHVEHTVPKPWATTGKTPDRERNVITSLHIQPEKMEGINKRLQAKYKLVCEQEVRYEELQTADADVLVVAFGLAARISERAVLLARSRGIRAGLLRPITLYPFPTEVLAGLSRSVRKALVVEMNAGQMVEDVKLSVEGRVPVAFLGKMGGIMPSPEEILERIIECGGEMQDGDRAPAPGARPHPHEQIMDSVKE
jgi:2-oxoglutarate ferredoxin oxidoreductase subunit alpha